MSDRLIDSYDVALFDLDGVAPTGGEQRDVGRLPTVLEEAVDDVVRGIDRLVRRAPDEFHVGPGVAAGVHARRREGTERLGDLFGVA